MATVVVVGKDRKAPKYRGLHAAGWTPYGNDWKVTPSPAIFNNFDALIGAPAASASALLDAAGSIAESVGADLAQWSSVAPGLPPPPKLRGKASRRWGRARPRVV